LEGNDGEKLELGAAACLYLLHGNVGTKQEVCVCDIRLEETDMLGHPPLGIDVHLPVFVGLIVGWLDEATEVDVWCPKVEGMDVGGVGDKVG